MLDAVVRGVLVPVLVWLPVLVGCGGVASVDPEGTGGEVGSGGGPRTATGGFAGAGAARPGLDEPDAPDVVDEWSSYEPVACPETPPDPWLEACELFAVEDVCPEGTTCLPYSVYPAADDPCGKEQFGTDCFLVGSGRQGDPCAMGGCAAGHLCVLTGDGTQCVQLCDTFGGDTCPAGLLCEPIDVRPGIGGCY